MGSMSACHGLHVADLLQSSLPALQSAPPSFETMALPTAYEFGGLARDEPRNGRRAKGNQLSFPSSASELRATAQALLAGHNPQVAPAQG